MSIIQTFWNQAKTNFYCTLCGSRVSIYLLIDGMVGSILNLLYHIYGRSSSYHILHIIRYKCTVHYGKKIVRWSYSASYSISSSESFLMMSEIFNAVLRPISCECIANFCIPTPIELIQLGIKTRSKSWSIDFPWLFAKFTFRSQILDLCTYFEHWNSYFMLKNLIFVLKNAYFTTDFPNIKIIV